MSGRSEEGNRCMRDIIQKKFIDEVIATGGEGFHCYITFQY